ncbi:MAG: hypothetical protein RL033_7547 [Pseudomonadota bacterium]
MRHQLVRHRLVRHQLGAPRRPWIAIAALPLLLWSLPAFAQAPASPAETNEPTPTRTDKGLDSAQTTALEGGAFYLEVPVWKPKSHEGKPLGLSARFEWGDKGERTVEAARPSADAEQWRLTFPDQPKPDELARITLTYAFELTLEDHATLQTSTSELIDTVLQTVADAASADEGAFAERFSQASAALASAVPAKTLRQYGDGSGNDGLTVVLQQLGITLGADGSWVLNAVARENLVQLASATVTFRDAGRDITEAMAPLLTKLKAAKPSADQLSKCSLGDEPSKLDIEKARQAIGGCGALLEAELRASADTAEAATKVFLQQAADELHAALAQGPDAVMQVRDRKFAGAARRAPALADTYAYNATELAIYSARRDSKDAAWIAQLDKLKSRITAAVERTSRVEIGALLVAGGVQPRRYDIATGAVFAAGIKDVVVPLLISICPAAGCLKQNEVAWSAPWGWLRAISADAGIRAKTLDTQDPRQSDKLSFLLGLSYNPVTVLRVSLGGYAFENAQGRKSWNVVPYVGITFNVLNAAELLGGLGLSSQFEPQEVTPN